MRASVIVVNYNGGEEAAESVASLAAMAKGCGAEIIVVDNDSNDGSDRLIHEAAPEARLLREERNLGYARAVNRGLSDARGDALVILNPDVRPLEGALAGLVRAVLDGTEPCLIGGVMIGRNGRVTYDTARPLPVLSDILREGLFLPGRRLASRTELLRRLGDDRVVFAPAISGAAMALHKKTLSTLGPMDGDYFLYNEDVEWCRRALRLGVSVGVAASCVFGHGGGASTRKTERTAFAARVLSDFIYFCEGEGAAPEIVSRLWSQRLLFRTWLYRADARCAILGGRPSSRERAAIYQELRRRLRAFEWTPEISVQSGHPSRLLGATWRPTDRGSRRSGDGAERSGRNPERAAE
ncbi:MAG: glycosyltransferase [Candidatus Eisenbacteria bacterium]|nr:glycosyltransferase [Candidatus Eisenbacteria bacterium]